LEHFNDNLFKEKFDDLISSFHLNVVKGYIKYLIETDKRKAFAFIKKCLGHLDPLFQMIAVDESANLSNSKLIPYLEKLNGKKELWSFGSYDCVICYGSLNSASKKAISLIKKSNHL
jgi:hypothetical protein